MTFRNRYKSITIEIPGVGPVLFEQSMRARHLNITVRPNNRVRVAVPRGISFEKAGNIVLERTGWIRKQLAKIQKLEKSSLSDSEFYSKIDQYETGKLLINRLDELAEKYGFTHRNVTIRHQKTLWGSCSAKNNISLNMRLAALPAKLRDYVILHELVHTRIKNHSRQFWAELDKYVGNSKAIRKEMKQYPLSIL